MERQKTQNSQQNIEGIEERQRTDITQYQDSSELQQSGQWYWQKYRQIDQLNRIESPEINPHKYNQLTFDKVARAVERSKDSLFYKRCQNNWTSTFKRMKLDTNLTPFTKINLKWIINLNVECKSIKLQNITGESLNNHGYAHNFL